MIRKPLANYAAEKALFHDLVESDREPNILLFQGESGSGKSHLIEYCLSSLPQDMPSAALKLQSKSEAIPALFTTMGTKLGWEAMPQFTGTVARLLEQPQKLDDPLWQMGMRRHVAEIGKISDQESRLDRFQLLTDAWFADVTQLDQPFLLAVDGYEQASSMFKRWFGDDFLYGVANYGRMRVLVGGQEVPTLEPGWSFCANLRELGGVSEVEAWLDWASETGYQVPSPDILAGIVLALKGNPSEIVKIIEAQFPLSEEAATPLKSEVAKRKQIHKNIIQAFSLEELKSICYYLGIAYENLSGHRDQLSTFARELLAYTRRSGLQDELFETLQAERPNLQWVG